MFLLCFSVSKRSCEVAYSSWKRRCWPSTVKTSRTRPWHWGRERLDACLFAIFHLLKSFSLFSTNYPNILKVGYPNLWNVRGHYRGGLHASGSRLQTGPLLGETNPSSASGWRWSRSAAWSFIQQPCLALFCCLQTIRYTLYSFWTPRREVYSVSADFFVSNNYFLNSL